LKGGDDIATAVAIRTKLDVKSAAELIKYLNLLIYGEPGAGKTKLASTAQDSSDTSPILFLDVEGGTVTLRKRKDIDVVKVRSMAQVEQIHNELFKDPGYYKSVVLDSLTELQKLDMRTVMQEQYDKKPDTTDIDVPSQREWGKSGERMRKIIRAYRDLPMHTICTCLLGSEHDEANNVYNYFPSLPGKLRGEVPGYFDVVGLLKAVADSSGNITRNLQTAKTTRVVAKDRTDSLDALIENPTIPLMWSAITGDS